MSDYNPNGTGSTGNNTEDSYDLLHRNFSMFGAEVEEEIPPADEDVKNSGEIYFSANAEPAQPFAAASNYTDADFDLFSSESRMRTVQTGPRERSAAAAAAARPAVKQSAAPAKQKHEKTASAAGKKKKKRKKKKNSKKSLLLALLILIFVVLISAIVRVPVLGCMNDILAIDRSETQMRVILDRTMTTSEVLDLLDQKGLIYSSNFCKIVSRLLGYAKIREYEDGPYVDRTYPAGTYFLSPSMGVEGMLRELYTSGEEKSTVTLTFPEGYTIDQIIERLALNGVASEKALYDVINSDSFFETYEFLNTVTDRGQRYRALEGYMYPDTYEFYIGENPESVINRFLKNFNEKWNQNFAGYAAKSDYTIDEVLTIASILEKEASDAEQMGVIASILYNRLTSSSFPYLNCDSTAKYIEAHEEALKTNNSYLNLMMHYDTNQTTGLPVGPICNPGYDAILAALNPDTTDYYYFLHDPDGRIYLARTYDEHQANMQYMGD